MILVDLQKTFDTLDHATVFEKIKCIRFKESVIKLFESYLPNRKCLVRLEDVFSDTGLTNCSVPQGSILRLLLFLIYINNLPQALNKSESYLFTDNKYVEKKNQKIFRHSVNGL